jgi:hypothetical protein
MSSSINKLVVFGILLASLSQSVCVAKLAPKKQRLERILYERRKTRLNRNYLKTPSGRRRAVSYSLNIDKRGKPLQYNPIVEFHLTFRFSRFTCAIGIIPPLTNHPSIPSPSSEPNNSMW